MVSVWHHKEQAYYSGFHGPFGGFYSEKDKNPHLTPENIENLLSYLRLKNETTDQDLDVKIRLFPEKIFPDLADSQLSALTSAGFHENFSDTAHYIMLDIPWRNTWRRDRTRDFKKSIEKIHGMQIESDDGILAVYDIIVKNADHKNRSFSLGLQDLNRMHTVLPAEDLNLWIFKLTTTGENVAAAICQIVDNNVVYVFRWGHVYNYKEHGLESSPMTFVANQLCEEYSNRGFNVLYIGTSSHEGVLDENLAHFKESLGALRTSITSTTLKLSD